MKTLIPLEGKRGWRLQGIGIGNNFINENQMAWEMLQRINNCDLIFKKALAQQEKTPKKWKDSAQSGKNS